MKTTHSPSPNLKIWFFVILYGPTKGMTTGGKWRIILILRSVGRVVTVIINRS